MTAILKDACLVLAMALVVVSYFVHRGGEDARAAHLASVASVLAVMGLCA